MRSNGNAPKVTIDVGGVAGGTSNVPDQMVGVLFAGVKDQDRDNLIAKLFTMKIHVGCCGKEYTYNFKNFPREDLKCDCGAKGRWVVKYE